MVAQCSPSHTATVLFVNTVTVGSLKCLGTLYPSYGTSSSPFEMICLGMDCSCTASGSCSGRPSILPCRGMDSLHFTGDWCCQAITVATAGGLVFSERAEAAPDMWVWVSQGHHTSVAMLRASRHAYVWTYWDLDDDNEWSTCTHD